GVAPLMKQLIANLERRAEKKILAPRFVYPYVIEDSQNLISGAPFQEGEADSPIMSDIRRKLEALELGDDEFKQLLNDATQALRDSVQPGYQSLITYLEKLQHKADDRAGAWKLPEGETFYASALRNTTTTDLSAQDIHQSGLDEVKRIHGEMRVLIGQ